MKDLILTFHGTMVDFVKKENKFIRIDVGNSWYTQENFFNTLSLIQDIFIPKIKYT